MLDQHESISRREVERFRGRLVNTVSEPVTPSVRLVFTAAGAIVLANLIAVVPAVIAGGMRPAPALRAE